MATICFCPIALKPNTMFTMRRECCFEGTTRLWSKCQNTKYSSDLPKTKCHHSQNSIRCRLLRCTQISHKGRSNFITIRCVYIYVSHNIQNRFDSSLNTTWHTQDKLGRTGLLVDKPSINKFQIKRNFKPQICEGKEHNEICWILSKVILFQHISQLAFKIIQVRGWLRYRVQIPFSHMI